jgi:asparagine synthase (glutamine-hydrolysing)
MRNQLLRDTDWASMAHSLEVRVPLVDAVLLRVMAAGLGSRATLSKGLLATAPRVSLPKEIIERPKTGFTTPIQTWLQLDSRIQHWRKVPSVAAKTCPWVRRWACEVAEVAAA